MIDDARHYPERTCLKPDICIVGAGPAGLTLARHFAGSRVKVLLLESGGLSFEGRPQGLSRGALVGDPYEPLNICRVRQFGGTTGKPGWGGWCKPLSREDFRPRPWASSEGWPIGFEELEPYYTEAADLLNLPTDIEWEPRSLPGVSDTTLMSEPCALTPTPALGKLSYDALSKASNIQVLLHATAGPLSFKPGSSEIDSISVFRRGKQPITVQARYFVLAAGGIENARLLLVSTDRSPDGIGNDSGLVGRYFMEHPHLRWGHFVAARSSAHVRLHNPRVAQQALARHRTRPEAKVPIAGLTINPALQEEKGILRSRSWIKPAGPAEFGVGTQALHDLTFWARKGRMPPHVVRNAGSILTHGREVAQAVHARLNPSKAPDGFFLIDTIVEQEPQYANRVRLGRKTDPFGMPRVELEWRLSPLVLRTLEETRAIITRELARWNLAQAPDAGGGQAVAAIDKRLIRTVRHHIGTTRLAADSGSGVVDRDSRVFGVPNLFVAGSSVFPTAGNDMPTMTIIALAFRLARHLGGLL